MYVKTRCPHCNRKLKINQKHLGSSLRCPDCKRRFVFESFEPPSGPQAAEGSSSGAVQERVVPADIGAVGPAAPESAPSPVGSAELEGLSGKSGDGEKSRGSALEGSSASLLLSFVLGLLIAAVFFAVLYGPLKGSYVSILFTKRGPVQHAIVLLTTWAGSLLVLKLLKLRMQRSSLLFDVLPREIADQIQPDNAHKFQEHIRSLPTDSSRSFLLTRILNALDHLRFRGSVQEVSHLLASQGELQSAAMDTSYTMVRVFIWAIPILGFIGTVLGIGDAVNNFSGALGQAKEISEIQVALNGVTGGLAVAFDTTLAALVMSLILMIPTNWIQQAEEGLLNAVTDYCNEELVSRLNDKSLVEAPASSLMSQPMDCVVEELRHLGADVSGAVTAGLPLIHKAIQDAQADQVKQIQDAFQKILDTQGRTFDKWVDTFQKTGQVVAANVAEGWKAVQVDMQAQGKEQADRADKVLKEASAERKAFVAEIIPLHRDNIAKLAQVGEAIRETGSRVQADISGLQATQAQSFQDVCASLSQNLHQIQDEIRSTGKAHVEEIRKLADPCVQSFASLVAQGKAAQRDFAAEAGKATAAVKDSFAQLSAELVAELRTQFKGVTTVADAAKDSATKLSQALDDLRDSDAQGLKDATAALAALSQALGTTLPKRVSEHMAALLSTLKGYEKLTALQKAIALQYKAFVQVNSLPKTVEALASEVADLGEILERIDSKLDELKPQQTRWLGLLARRSNGHRT
jgi:biopolymer transport protein ExbB/TolQ